MTETRHIRLDYNDALYSKKELLSAEISLLQTLRKIRAYKILRRKEIAQKNKLKTLISSLKFNIESLQGILPTKQKQGIKKVKERIFKDARKEFSEELEDIKKKLEKLNRK